MEISAKLVKELRDKTGTGMMDCKKALKETDGDLVKAVEWLRKKGISKAEKRSGRATNQGQVFSYIHPGGRVGVLVEVNCETDFVAKTDGFLSMCKDVAMQIAAVSPLYVQREEVPQEVVENELNIYKTQAENEKKPANIAEKIALGRIGKYYGEVCLMEQAFVKDPNKTIKEYLSETIAKTGENISVRRFVRYELGN